MYFARMPHWLLTQSEHSTFLRVHCTLFLRYLVIGVNNKHLLKHILLTLTQFFKAKCFIQRDADAKGQTEHLWTRMQNGYNVIRRSNNKKWIVGVYNHVIGARAKHTKNVYCYFAR